MKIKISYRELQIKSEMKFRTRNSAGIFFATLWEICTLRTDKCAQNGKFLMTFKFLQEFAILYTFFGAQSTNFPYNVANKILWQF